MYESFFQFQSRPFTATPNTECFFPSASTQQSLDSVLSAIERASGAALIVGGSGLGKSLFLQVIRKRLRHDYSVAILESASITSRRELLQSILFELGLPYRGMEEGELRLTLLDYLKATDRCPNGLLLCVDEAHLLPTNLLEEMRMITNLVRDGQPRARLVLAGNLKIEERMTDPQLESLNQRIAVRAYLQPMNQAETRHFVDANLNFAGSSAMQVFDDEALDAVYVATNGIPRLINQVCDHALVLAVADGIKRVTKELINEAWSDIQRLPVQWHVLGADTSSNTEHVIEFGSLDDEASPGDSSAKNSSVETTVDESTSGSVWPTTDLVELGDGPATSNEVDAAGAAGAPEAVSEPAEPEPEPFVFKGPANPFAESFQDEEYVVDSFTQIIGHSPQRPIPAQPTMPPTGEANEAPASIPEPNVSEPTTPETPTELEIGFAEEMPSTELPTNSGDEIGLAGSEQTMPEAQDLETGPKAAVFDFTNQDNSDVSVDNESPGTPTTDSKSPEPAQQTPDSTDLPTLADYLAKSSDAITFGVGQGIYADQFSNKNSIEPSDATPLAENESATQSQTEDKTEHEELAAETPSAPTDKEYSISRTVSSIRRDLQSATSENIKEDDARNEALEPDASSSADDISIAGKTQQATDEESTRQDDRDMIIVEEEVTPGPPVESVPLQNMESKNSGQAKREDYQKLFDRLRNG